MHKKHSAILDTLLTNSGKKAVNDSRKAIWSRHDGKTCRAGDNNPIRTAAAMDDQEIAVRVLTADDAYMGIVRIEHKVARLRVIP